MTAPLIDFERSRARLYRTAAAIVRRVCEVPEDITVTDWCDREIMLPSTSASPGRFDSSIVPYARRWHDLGADPSVSKMVLCWASQTIKSTTIHNIMAYRIVHMPSPMVIVQPKIDSAEAWAKERFVPMVRATPALRSRVALGRSSGSTLRYYPIPGGFVFAASAQSATELASRSSPFICSDEVDRMEEIPGEGSPIEIVDRRQGSSDVGLHIMTSTPRDAETTIIWPYLEGGTYELYHVRCPHCGRAQPLFWAGLRWDAGHPETAYYVCGGADSPNGGIKSPVLEAYLNSPIAERDGDGRLIGCGAVIDERYKPHMLTSGERDGWRAMNPGAEYPSSHLHGLYSPFAKSNWSTLAKEFLRAKGKRGDLRVVVNTRFSETYEETTDSVSGDSLLNRLEPRDEGIVPDGVGLLTAGVDVQDNRVEAYIWGWGAGLESWLIASYILQGDPQREPDRPGSVWRELDAKLATVYPHELSGGVPVVGVRGVFVDSGFAATQVYRYTNRRKGRKIFASKGVGDDGVPLLGKPTVQGPQKTVLYPVGTNKAKSEFLRSQILERDPGPGYVHLSEWMTVDQCEQLVSEKRRHVMRKGRVVYEWYKKQSDTANEALDCRNYARAALEREGTKVIVALGKLAATLSENAKAAAISRSPATTAPASRGRRVLSSGVE